MPSPRRVARKSVHLLVGMGMTNDDAARVVQIVCDEAAAAVWRRGADIDLGWLADIAAEAGAIRRREWRRPDAPALSWPERVDAWAADFDRKHGRLPTGADLDAANTYGVGPREFDQ